MRATLLAVLVAGLILPSVYGAPRKQGPIARKVEDMFKIYVLQPERRNRRERVIVRGSKSEGYRAVITYWRSLKSRDPAEEICNAYQWLLFGRGELGKGAVEVFKAIPALKEIQLHFFDVQFTTKVGKKRAEILPSKRFISYLKIGVTRNSILRKKLRWTQIENMISKGKCSDVGSRYVNTKWFDEGYLRKAK